VVSHKNRWERLGFYIKWLLRRNRCSGISNRESRCNCSPKRPPRSFGAYYLRIWLCCKMVGQNFGGSWLGKKQVIFCFWLSLPTKNYGKHCVSRHGFFKFSTAMLKKLKTNAPQRLLWVRHWFRLFVQAMQVMFCGVRRRYTTYIDVWVLKFCNNVKKHPWLD